MLTPLKVPIKLSKSDYMDKDGNYSVLGLLFSHYLSISKDDLILYKNDMDFRADCILRLTLVLGISRSSIIKLSIDASNTDKYKRRRSVIFKFLHKYTLSNYLEEDKVTQVKLPQTLRSNYFSDNLGRCCSIGCLITNLDVDPDCMVGKQFLASEVKRKRRTWTIIDLLSKFYKLTYNQAWHFISDNDDATTVKDRIYAFKQNLAKCHIPFIE